MVRRPRLAERLEAGVHEPLTLVAAPAGAGKSALLSTWAADRAAAPMAWLSLDPGDGERRRFWRGVLEALRRAGVGEPIASLEVQPSEGVGQVLPVLINALEARDTPVVLVLDDLHEIGDAPALRDLDRLLRHPSPALRIVVSTRIDPPLRVGRLRVAGELTEIRAADLAFTREETSELLAASGIAVDPEVVEALWTRTEGWAAGLRLAALTMRTHPDPPAFVAEFAGDDSTVAEYLLAEVLAQQPPEVRDYLLRLSVVDAANGELADAVTGHTDSARILAQLERDQVLLSTAGEARAWHRLHPLFAELLRSELRYEAPDEVPGLHRRAAKWFATNDRPLEALRHAAAAGDWEHVAELTSGHWVQMLLEGELGSIRAVLERMPEGQRRDDPELALAVAGVHVSAGDEPAARLWFDVARAGRSRVPAGRRAGFDLATAAVGLMRGRLRGDPDAALQNAQAMLEGGPDGDDAAPDDLRALAMTELGIAELWSGDLPRARRHLEAARGAAAAAGRDWLGVLAIGYLSAEAMLRGRFERAMRLAGEAEALAQLRGWSATWPVGITVLVRCAVAYHRNRLDEATVLERRSSVLLEHAGDRPLRAVVAIQRARLLAARGQPEPAFEALQEAREWIRGWPVMPAVAGLIAALEAMLLTAGGWADDADASLDGDPSDEVAVARAILRLRAGDADGALAVLMPRLEGDGPMLQSTRAEAWVNAALAHDAAADEAGALDAIERALAEAEPGNMQRAFLVHGAAITPLLERHRRAGTSHRALLEDVLTALAQHGDGRPVATLPETLSDREAAVLSYLPTMMSNQEIAAELFVSVNTVKTHLKAIYRKLDVEDRRGAVRRARELALLGPP
jgi:LuxR family transcriptional regulator, maltose regulon positive regulatory protein